MTQDETIINALLGALNDVNQRLARWRLSSSVHGAGSAFGVFRHGETDPPLFGIDGYAESVLDDGSAFDKTFTCWREDGGWLVSRTVALGPTVGENIEIELVGVKCSDSTELARVLPDLVQELLDAPVPDAEQ